MEEIIIAMLFLYPGALVDVCDRIIFPNLHKEVEMSDSARLAKYFVYSVFISVISLLAYAQLTQRGVSNIETIQRSLAGTMEIPKYLGISLVCTVLFTLFLRGLRWIEIQVKSAYMNYTEGTTPTNHLDTWRLIRFDNDFKQIRSMMIAKIQNGNVVRAGFLQYMPDKFEEGLGLTATQVVMDQLEAERDLDPSSDEFYIGYPLVSYYDTKAGTFVDIYDGRKLHECLNKAKNIEEKATGKD